MYGGAFALSQTRLRGSLNRVSYGWASATGRKFVAWPDVEALLVPRARTFSSWHLRGKHTSSMPVSNGSHTIFRQQVRFWNWATQHSSRRRNDQDIGRTEPLDPLKQPSALTDASVSDPLEFDYGRGRAQDHFCALFTVDY